ncbi:hypothetical protein [Algibacillus agarilyticus]|uniref:hypothetical protein n=1 Tax=Algibacillus agarilyticus TaxID=2234133 RepID=UPI000DD09E7F|nr:hypothetical protein [Algibacillus agarilyticus]
MRPFNKTLLATVIASCFALSACGGSDDPADADNDGVIDVEDAFPNDASETLDTDKDGIGNNADTDDDGDGYADSDEVASNSDPLSAASKPTDTDNDFISDATDPDDDNDGVSDVDEATNNTNPLKADSDDDGVNDNVDEFPNDATETVDTDNDGTGDNADTDDDNDGVSDVDEATNNTNSLKADSDDDGSNDNVDAFPNDPAETVDTDGDGTGNNADTDDDNDGVSDTNEATNNTNPLKADSDDDGVNDNVDAFPNDAAETTDTDGDGMGNNADTDDDADGYSDVDEIANNSDPLDASSKPLDTDGDFIPNSSDPDDDNDGVSDVDEAKNNSDPLLVDTDSDGTNDDVDKFPADPAETVDNDNDGVGDNADTDDDNDGIPDTVEVAAGLDPFDAADAALDSDGDSVSNLDEYNAGTSITVANASVSGVIIAGSVKSGSTSGAAISGAVVDISIFNTAGNVIATQSSSTGANGNYQVRIADQVLVEQPNLHNSFQVSVSKKGFAQGVFKADSTKKSGQQISLNAALQPVATKTVKVKTDTAVTASDGVRKLKFGLFKRKSSGQVSLLAGEEYQAAKIAADGDVSNMLTAEIPFAFLPDDLEKVTIESGYFNPNSEKDRNAFPGDFVATGNTENQGVGITLEPDSANAAAEDDEEYRLISSVFAALKISDQDGNNLTLDDSAATAADGDPVITLAVPTDSYSTIVRDQDASMTGVQVPIYVYNDGWKFVGNATLVIDLGVGVTEYQSSGFGLYEGALVPTVDSVIGGNLYAYIEIVDGNDWLQWVNVDWPILAANEETINSVCFEGSVVYESGSDEPEAFAGYVDIQLPDGGYEWNYVEESDFRHDTLTSETGTPDDWLFNIWNEKTNDYESIDKPFDTIVVNDDTGENCNDFGQIVLSNPFRCKIEGSITNSAGAPAEWLYVQASNTSSDYFNYAYSNDSGMYSINVPCDEAVTLQPGFDESAATNRTVTSTQGKLTVNFVLENQAPQVEIWGDDEADSAEAITLNYWTFDADGNDVSVVPTCDKTCDVSVVDGDSLAFSAQEGGTYTISLVATDDASLSKSARTSWEVEVFSAENNLPDIVSVQIDSAVYASPSVINHAVSFENSLSVNIDVFADDVDGDDLTYSWQGCTSTSPLCTLSDVIAGETYNVTVEVSDGIGFAQSQQMAIFVKPDGLPTITYLYADAVNTPSADGVSTAAITLAASATDDKAKYKPANDSIPKLVPTWSIMQLANADGTLSTPMAVALDSFTVSNQKVVINAGQLPVGRYTVTYTVSDSVNDDTVSKSTNFSVITNDSAVVIIE